MIRNQFHGRNQMLVTDDPLIIVTLPIELENRNDGRGHSFWRTAKERSNFETALRRDFGTVSPLDFPVWLRITRILWGARQRFWDQDSILRGNAKELIDAMVACGWFHDDSRKWIRLVVGDQKKNKQDGPATVIEIFKAEGT